MPAFHDASARFPRSWLVARRLFGVSPLIPPADAKPEDLVCWARSQVAAQLGSTEAQVKDELTALRGRWKASTDPVKELAAGLAAPSAAEPSAPPTEFFAEEKLLEEFDFPEDMFEFEWEEKLGKEVRTVGRTKDAQRRERNWFIKRLGEMQRMLREPRSAPLARQAIMNELWLRRYEAQMHRLNPVSSEGVSMSKRIMETQSAMKEQLDELDDMFPELGLASKVKFRAVISDFIAAVRDYYAKEDNRMINYLGTAPEISVLMRQNQQAPTPQYRGDIALTAQEAAAGLFDPNFRSQLKASELKKYREGVTAGIMKVREDSGEPLIDLEDDNQWEP
jgi:hypothetical protein